MRSGPQNRIWDHTRVSECENTAARARFEEAVPRILIDAG